MNVVVVESPAKAKTIEKYLGKDFSVLASYGHVSDLPSKDGSVLPERDFVMLYETNERSVKQLKAIATAVKGAENLYLATDPDREGEAISWHVLNWLKEHKAINGTAVRRVVFHEITKDAVRDAMAHPRDIDMDLVNAQQARRALDYLVGFNLSPVLWRKLPGSRSAGRVQSVALRLICAREAEIEAFVPREYWTVEADFATSDGSLVTARLSQLDGAKLDKFALGNRGAAEAAAQRIHEGSFSVAAIERKQVKRNPQPPFITSTLQQEASRKLGFNARQTMQVAQKLYEGIDIGGETVGLITYMRTDSTSMAGVALHGARDLIRAKFGPDYVPEQPRQFRSKAKNAQEAHEAIRPTGFERTPDSVGRYLNDDQRRLYELIWKRALASQMAHAVLDQVAVDIATATHDVVLRATGSVIAFDGFMKLYLEGRDDPGDDEDAEGRLPDVKEGEALERKDVRPEQHYTEPPPRFTEASLVKRLEELGIGRPSTYASIISVLQERDYVVLDRKRFAPQDRGRLVTAFLESFFSQYVEYDFTADLESELDRISNGELDWKDVLREFWNAFHMAVDSAQELQRSDVLARIEGILEAHIFPQRGDGEDSRRCTACKDGNLGLKLGKFGAFIGCSNYPDCKFTRPLVTGGAEDEVADNGPKVLGDDPETGLEVSLRKGPYGHYVQLGGTEDGGEKPKRTGLPRGMSPGDIGLETALRLLALPREVGDHPDDGQSIVAGIGRYGPFLKHGDKYVSLPKDDDILTIGLNRAVTVIAEGKTKGGGRTAAEPLRELGAHPEDGKPIVIKKGRYGPYIQHNRVFASVPKGTEIEAVTIEQAVALLTEKAAKKGKSSATKAKPKPKKATKKAAKKRSSGDKAGARAQAET